MSWGIAVVGTIHLNDIYSPCGHRSDQLGGSAVYFPLAACRFARVFAVSAMGADGEASVHSAFAGRNIDVSNVVVRNFPTGRSRSTHDFTTWCTINDNQSEEIYDDWLPVLNEAAASAEVLLLGSATPKIQRHSLQQSRARLIGSDSMLLHIGADRPGVKGVVDMSDILFCDRPELAALTQTQEADWRATAQSLCGQGRVRAVIVKAGPAGAACVTKAGIVERDAHPVDVIDLTGAGDALAGGFLGVCAQSERDDEEFFPLALDRGMECAAQAIASFGTEALQQAR